MVNVQQRIPPPNNSSISIYSNPPCFQNFSIPENIIFYISKNPNRAKVYNKLIKICKYFYLKNQIITFHYLESSNSTNFFNVQKINGIKFKNKLWTLPSDFSWNQKIKIWFNKRLDIGGRNNIFAASILSKKIFRCDINRLGLYHQYLTLEEFKIFVSNGKIKTVDFHKIIVRNEKSLVVPIEKLIELLPNLIHFNYSMAFESENESRSITLKTAENLLAIPHFVNLQHFKLNNAPEIFDYETFIYNQKNPAIDINFTFHNAISDDFKSRLERMVDKIIATGINENRRRPAFIAFPEMDYLKHKILQQMRANYSNEFD